MLEGIPGKGEKIGTTVITVLQLPTVICTTHGHELGVPEGMRGTRWREAKGGN